MLFIPLFGALGHVIHKKYKLFDTITFVNFFRKKQYINYRYIDF